MFGSCFRTLAVILFQIINYKKKLENHCVWSQDCIKVTNWSITPLFQPLQWFLIQQRVQYKINPLCYKCITRTAPSYLCDCLQLYTPSRTLRSASDTLSLQIPRTRLSTVGSSAFSVFGPSTWNDLALPLRQKPSLDSFKCNSKHFFSPNYGPVVFSVPCCCRIPSQVCLLPVLSRVN